MPKLKPDTQRARRDRVLDAAEVCIARAGFHGATMQDICAEAGISAGALYIYFKSKEDLIAGIVERDRGKFAEQMKELASAPDLLAALSVLAEHYAVEEPRHKRLLCIEIGCEATRNEAVGRIFRSVDEFCLKSFEDLLGKARSEGRIDPALDTRQLAQLIAVIGDGLFWRRAIDPRFDAKALMPAAMKLIETLLNPKQPSPSYSKHTFPLTNPKPGRS